MMENMLAVLLFVGIVGCWIQLFRIRLRKR